jgi:hypothetical protein
MRWSQLTPVRRRTLGVLAVMVGLALTALFGYRAIRVIDYHQRVARGEIQVESLRGWMTLSYIAQHYGVPESALRESLGLPDSGHDERNLSQWFQSAAIDPIAGRKTVEALILSSRIQAKTPPP